ncbi:MAG: hypothetical protein EAZ85_08060 [Bacteroidetes bacterium]|nr:MAG: hypothetical protein EAZ85_08060 [Bacteroidota bacterium]TAG89098.1 MAG: hypothetical protein EAZ20_07205 [Bacteroidota bacterium]
MQPNEIFTYPKENISQEAQDAVNNHFCRFLDKICDKQSRTISYPMGVCSVWHHNKKAIICPHRFLEDNLVFEQISEEVFGAKDNVLLLQEVKITNVGSFDFVLVKFKPLTSKVEDFCIVEFQSDSTTSTGQLVESLKDFMDTKELKEKYSFGLNTYNTIKLSYIQMLIKGQVMEKWNKNIVWVMQNYVYENMVNRFQLSEMEYKKEKNTKYFLYDLIGKNNVDYLTLVDKKASTIANLLKAFTHQDTPSLSDFIEILTEKIKEKIKIKD